MITTKTPKQLRDEALDAAYGAAVLKTVLNMAKGSVALTTLPLRAWLLMLVLGAVHTVAAPVAAAGYGTAFLLMVGVDLSAMTVKKFRK